MVPQFRDARFVTIPGAKPLPHEENPDVVVRHLLEFFG